jgi:transcriptional regulator with PAS, ATPase and Fis domain
VRQLENAVEMAIAVSGDRDVLYTRDFGLTESRRVSGAISALASVPVQIPEAVDFDTAVSRFELAMLENALRASDGNKTAAAEKLGIKRTTLIMKIRNFENSGFQLQKVG